MTFSKSKMHKKADAVKSLRLYDLLDVPTDASHEELRRAYKRKAMELHPDRSTADPEAKDKFVNMKYAYDVLSDPLRRSVYDKGGESAVRAMEEASVLLPTQWAARALAIYSFAQCLFLLVLLLILTFFFSIPILWCLKLDGIIDWKYRYVMMPMWIFDIGLFLSLGNKYFIPPDGLRNQALVNVWARYRPFMYVFMVIKLLSFVIFQFFIVARLDHDVMWATQVVFIPWFCYEGIVLLESCMLMILVWQLKIEYEREVMFESSHLDERLLIGDNSEEEVILTIREGLQDKAEASLQQAAVRIAFSILLCLKIEGVITGNWALVFLPIWLELGSQLLVNVLDLFFLCTLTRVEPEGNDLVQTLEDKQCVEEKPGDDSPDTSEEDVEAPTVSSFLLQILFNSAGLTTFVIICFLLEWPGWFSTFYVLLPCGVIAGVFALSLCYNRWIFSSIEEEEHEKET